MRIPPKGKGRRIGLPLQSTLEKLIDGDTISVVWVSNLIRKKLEERGVLIGDREFAAIREDVRKRWRKEDGLSWESKWELDIDHEADVDLDFGSDDLDDFEEFVADIMSSVVQETIEASRPIVLAEALTEIDTEFERRTRETEAFRDRLIARWRKPLKLLSAQIALAGKFGEDTNAWLRDNPPEGKASVVEAVTRLQARATQIASEIEVLLQYGFADGALSRWRTLHEVSIVALFIEQEGEETARRYLDHLEVESRDMARFLRKAFSKSDGVEIPDEKFEQLEERVSELRTEHGNEFDGYHGWASKAIEARTKARGHETKRKVNPTFFDLEEAVDMDRLRPSYKLASSAVHASPKGAFFKLGLLPHYSDAILAGPSNAGLSEAGRLTAWSLTMTCTALLMVEPMVDGLIWAGVISDLGSKAGEAFVIAEGHLCEDESKFDKQRSHFVGGHRPRLRRSEKPSASLRRKLGQ